MPETALGVLTLEDMKIELQIDNNRSDARITRAIQAAVDDVSIRTDLPFVDEDVELEVRNALNKEPVELKAWNLDATDPIVSVRYWLTTDAFRIAPTGVIDVTTLGRVEGGAGRRNCYPKLYPPEAGWPLMLADAPMLVTVKRSLAEIKPIMKQAVILSARDFFEGQREAPARSATSIVRGVSERRNTG